MKYQVTMSLTMSLNDSAHPARYRCSNDDINDANLSHNVISVLFDNLKGI